MYRGFVLRSPIRSLICKKRQKAQILKKGFEKLPPRATKPLYESRAAFGFTVDAI